MSYVDEVARVTALEAENRALRSELTTIKMLSMCIYLSARWTSDRLAPEAEERLWGNLRDGLGLPPGLSSRVLEARPGPYPVGQGRRSGPGYNQ